MTSNKRTIIVGDVHGCGEELLALLDKLAYPRPGDRLIFVGDLFDRGPLPQLVLQTILDHKRRGPQKGYGLESVCGNHDAELRAYCRMLYDDTGRSSSLSRTQQRTIDAVDRAGMLEDLAIFLEDLDNVDTIRDSAGEWAVVHAGIDPVLGLDATPGAIKRTIKALPGLPAWYDEYDGDDGLLICGHQHQAEPLVRSRDGQPVVINVDTGCCYGGALTAYLVEESQFMSVPAARVYYRERP
ncbi:MAG: metallophosphoesterase [Planctomycetota bacterium]